MNEIPVYLFTGFLEAGKTTMIQRAMEDAGFNAGEQTLLLVCEEGEEEFDPTAFASTHAWIETVDDESALTPDFLARLEEKYHMERVIVEYNGVWQLSTFFRALPDGASLDMAGAYPAEAGVLSAIRGALVTPGRSTRWRQGC